MSKKTDLGTKAFMFDPAAVASRLREEGPLVRQKVPFIGEVWLTTTQEHTAAILKDSANFTVRKDDGRVVGMRWWMPATIRRLTHNMLSMDEPDHTRLRAKVDAAFHRRNISTLEPRIRDIAERMAVDLFKDGETADLIPAFARQLPLAVICELLGLPREDHQRFMGWANGLTKVNGLVAFLMAMPGLRAMANYLQDHIDHVRGHPDADSGLIHALVHDEDGEPMTKEELLSMVFLLLVAGHETTTHLIGVGVYALLTNPDQKDWLAEDWSRTGLAVEELLRFVTPVQVTKPRFARKDMRFDGVTIKRGDLVMPTLAAANTDPAVFSKPERLKLSRKPNRHMAFGTGIHFCLGHQLARLEAACALEALFTRHPGLKLAVDEAELRWRERLGLRALESLPVAAG